MDEDVKGFEFDGIQYTIERRPSFEGVEISCLLRKAASTDNKEIVAFFQTEEAGALFKEWMWRIYEYGYEQEKEKKESASR